MIEIFFCSGAIFKVTENMDSVINSENFSYEDTKLLAVLELFVMKERI